MTGTFQKFLRTHCMFLRQLKTNETIKDKHNFDYIIKTIENNIPLGQDIGEEFHLLS